MDIEEIIALRRIVKNFITDGIDIDWSEGSPCVDSENIESTTENILIYISKRYNITVKESE